MVASLRATLDPSWARSTGEQGMREILGRFGQLALIGFLVTALPLATSAQFREFTGRIDRIDERKMIVDNRMGDKVSFVPAERTAVDGQGKKSWQSLKKSDWVSVSWKMVDKPRVAYKVKVLPPKNEAGDDR